MNAAALTRAMWLIALLIGLVTAILMRATLQLPAIMASLPSKIV